MFGSLRDGFRSILDGSLPPAERGAALARMKETLVQARLGVEDLRGSLGGTRARLEAERLELDTMRRRRALATGISDHETASLAERYERQHEGRVRLLEQKLALQEEEVAIGERDVAEMTAELHRAAAGLGLSARPDIDRASRAEASDAADPDAALRSELDGLSRARSRAQAEQIANERLDALKRRMGK